MTKNNGFSLKTPQKTYWHGCSLCLVYDFWPCLYTQIWLVNDIPITKQSPIREQVEINTEEINTKQDVWVKDRAYSGHIEWDRAQWWSTPEAFFCNVCRIFARQHLIAQLSKTVEADKQAHEQFLPSIYTVRQKIKLPLFQQSSLCNWGEADIP